MMNEGSATERPQNEATQEQLADSICQQFADAWRAGKPSSIEELVNKVSDAHRRDLIVKLICADMEFRWRSDTVAPPTTQSVDEKLFAGKSAAQRDLGTPFTIDQYLARFPGLGPADAPPLEIVVQDYRVRHAWGDRPPKHIYTSRFPSLIKELNAALAAADSDTLVQRASDTVHLVRQSDVPAPDHPAAAAAGITPLSIGKYRIIGKLDAGGQAVVYRAIHQTLEKELVIKIATVKGRYDESNKRRLVAEGRLLADLNHPNLARIYDLDFHDERPYLVMEYIRGRSLFQAAKAAPKTPAQAAAIVAKIARALEYAHTRGVLHKDIKPQNVLLDDMGEPHLIDFGLAEFRHAWADDQVQIQSISGTAQYMPPEQARGDSANVDERSDIFALGALLYFLLTGKAPFRGADLYTTLNLARKCEFDAELLKNSKADRALIGVCLRAMSADPAARFTTAGEMANALERLAGKGVALAWKPIAIGAAVVFVAALAYFMNQPTRQEITQSPPQAPTPSAQIRPSLNIEVTRGDQNRELADAVPLREGDLLQVSGELRTGLKVSLYWFDSEGNLHELPAEDSTQHGESFRFVWPSKEEMSELTGPAGTEVILLAASSRELPDRAAMEQIFGVGQPFPQVGNNVVLTLDGRDVRVNSRARAGRTHLQTEGINSRGPGGTRVLPEAPALQRAESISEALAKEFDVITGVAFPHVDLTGAAKGE